MSDADYNEAVDILQKRKINAAGYLIMTNGDFENKNSKFGKGVVIVRNRNGTDYL